MRFRHLHEGFGAEVLEIDVLGSVHSDEIQVLRSAYDEYHLLLFRCDRPIPPDRQVEISGWFGPIANHSDGNLWTVLRNDEAVGSARLPFHQDFSYTDAPLQGISLHAIDVPPCGTSTSYVSNRHSWETMPSHRQEQLASMTLRHLHISTLAEGWPDFVADHPIRLSHPRTAESLLFVTEHHANRIHELDLQESDRVIAELFDHIYAADNIYTHRWKLYDLVVWDNLAIQHARTEQAELAAGPRAVQRVAMSDVTIPELIDRGRRQQEQHDTRAVP